MPNLSQPVREISLRRFGGLVTYVDPRDLPGGASPLCTDVSFLVEGVGIRPGLTLITSGTAGNPFYFFQYYQVAGTAVSVIQQGGTITFSPGGETWDISAGARALGLVMPNGYVTLGISQPGTPWIGSGDPLRVSPAATPAGPFQMGTGGPGAAPTITESSGAWRPVSITQPSPARTVYSVIYGVPLDDVNAPPPSNVLTFLGEVNDVTFNYGIYAGDIVYASGFASVANVPDINGTYTVIGTGNYTGRYGYQKYVQVRSDISAGTFCGPYTGSEAGATLQKTRALVNVQPPLPAEGLVNSPTVSIGGTATGTNPEGIWNNAWNVVATPTLYELQITATQNSGNFATYTFYPVGKANPAWVPSYFYNVGDTIIDTYGHCWSVSVGGESGTSLPSFPASPSEGATETDNEVTWLYQSGMALTLTVFNTTNGEGIFNVQNATVTSLNNAGQLVTNVAIPASVGNIIESGYGILGAGNLIVIDPGQKTLGTGHPGVNPVYASVNPPQASATISVETPDLAPGQRYCIVCFQMEDGSITPASPPVSFYTTGTTNQLTISASGRPAGTALPIGPIDTIARIVAFTAAGAGIGGPYFYIPSPVYVPPSASTLGQPKTISATVIYDNTTQGSQINFTLTDTVLLNSVNITEVGNNRQQTRGIRPFAKALLDSGRCFYVGEQAAVYTLVNTDFAGGTLNTPNSIPGWTFRAGSGQGTANFGVAETGRMYLTLGNVSGAVLNPDPSDLSNAVCLTQSIELTAENTQVLVPGTAYNVRVVAGMMPGSTETASLVIEIDDAGGQMVRQFVIPPSSLTVEGEFDGEILLENDWGTGNSLPATLGIYPLNLPNTETICVYRVDLYPANQPTNSSQVAVSYAGDPAGVDAVTGVLDISDFTQDPITNIYRFLAEVFITTATRTFHVITDAATEPAFWKIREIANRAGCSGPLAQDAAEEFVVTADVNGVYVFDGGTHLRISQEIQQLWNQVVHPELTWVKVDLPNQRILVGVCLPTPNTWLPNDPALNPTTPNVILCCQYFGIETGRELGAEAPVTVSMFTGALLFREMRRKWTIWRIPAAYADWNASGELQLGYGGETGNPALCFLDPTAFADLGSGMIQQSYTTYAMPDSRDTEQLELGSHYHQYSYALVLAEGAGKMTVLGTPETLRNTLPAFTQPPFTLANPALDDVNVPLNITGNRLFLTVAASGSGSWFNLRRIVMGVQEARRVTVRGQ